MKHIENIERVTALYPDWKPGDIAFIKLLHWSAEKLSMVLLGQSRNKAAVWPDMSRPFLEIILSFGKVGNLKLNFSGPGMQQVAGFDILDLSADGLSQIN
ncbi:hypothetical protein, partial [Chitinophaga sp.]|uniref:hypothetical protein n=1 Tax=Chitinophaga sp. TaxID=1869181 RepID=UPI002B54CFA8